MLNYKNWKKSTKTNTGIELEKKLPIWKWKRTKRFNTGSAVLFVLNN